MPGSEALGPLRWLTRRSNAFFAGPERATQQCLNRPKRSIATESQSIATEPNLASDEAARRAVAAAWAPQPAYATVHDFPSMEPLRSAEYRREYLMMPLRRDILHRAVVYEGDMTRQGTASAKWRGEVDGSGRKLRPQKGMGMARVGDKKSPTRVGGGVAHGPHPRDFSTKLPRKIYDQAWRTALSYRFSRGQLLVIDRLSIPRRATPFLIDNIFKKNNWGAGHGRSTLITDQVDKELFDRVQKLEKHVKILDRGDVDVKDLLETGRLIIEQQALDTILKQHSRDLDNEPPKARY